MSMHDGHRQRLKQRFKEEGLDHFAPINVLELLLFYCIPRKDTNPIAHRLLDRFGSLSGVMNAEPDDLMAIEGVSESTALFLTMLPDVFRCYSKDANKVQIARTTSDCNAYLSGFFVGQSEEVVYLLCMDAKRKILCCREIVKGSVNSAAFSIRKILEVALSIKASTVVLAHNHPSGLAVPSGADVRTTQKVAFALQAADIILADHLIFSDDDCVSMAQSGYYDPDTVG